MNGVRRWTELDRAMVRLVRLALQDDWDPTAAAARLRDEVSDGRLLRHMALRVNRALDDRPSLVTQRAADTLTLALAETLA